jgi:hypothetical protein
MITDEERELRNSAISHAVYLFKDKSLAEVDKGFWPKTHEIYRFLRTGNHAMPSYRYERFRNHDIGDPKTEHALPEDARMLSGEDYGPWWYETPKKL